MSTAKALFSCLISAIAGACLGAGVGLVLLIGTLLITLLAGAVPPLATLFTIALWIVAPTALAGAGLATAADVRRIREVNARQ